MDVKVIARTLRENAARHLLEDRVAFTTFQYQDTYEMLYGYRLSFELARAQLKSINNVVIEGKSNIWTSTAYVKSCCASAGCQWEPQLV